MKRATASQARQRLASLLDAAERGETVAIERRGVLFELRAAPARKRPVRKGPRLFKILDPAVERGEWWWDWGPDGLVFRAGKPPR
jgi:antitoxin (DNA-binding transcriptional repressor) of toxin-antitoxin stability system